MARYVKNRQNADGLTRSEREILDLWDDGQPFNSIARETGIRIDRVKQVVSQLTGAEEHRQHCNAMVAGNQAFLAALAAA